MSVSAATRRAVRQRAGDACEYCRLPEFADDVGLQVEHIRARQHRGSDDLNNLALACVTCNRFKGPNLTGVDPQTDSVTLLFNPRLHQWLDHFRFSGATVAGLTAIGRATVVVLAINSPVQTATREALLAEGVRMN